MAVKDVFDTILGISSSGGTTFKAEDFFVNTEAASFVFFIL